MKIAVLGWGSLIWDQRELSVVQNKWHTNGPQLPVEFARVSNGGRLTLVIKPNWTEVQTLYATSAFEDLEKARENLQTREETSSDRIGYYNFLTGEKHIRAANEIILDALRTWAAALEIDAVIWTDLSPNFQDKLNMPFNLENIGKYLKGLETNVFVEAKRYIEKTDAQVQTRFRTEIAKVLGDIENKRLPERPADT